MSPNKNLNCPGEQLKPFSPRVQSCLQRGVEVRSNLNIFPPRNNHVPREKELKLLQGGT